MKQLFLNYKTFCSLRFWIIFSAERCEDTKIKAEVGMPLHQEQACPSILLCIVKMIPHMWAHSSFSPCVDKCLGSAWIFRCQLWLWSSFLRNVRRYSWALTDFCGTKLKHEPIAHPSTIHQNMSVLFCWNGGDLSTMLKGNLKTWAEEK